MTSGNAEPVAHDAVSALPNDAAVEERVKQIAARYPDRTGKVINVLNDVQDEYRYVPASALRAVARICDVSYDQLVFATEFFGGLSTEPVGKRIIEVCDGTACHTLGAVRLADAIADKLGIRIGETTPDGLVTLNLVHCVGACSVAPVIVVDESTYGRVKVSDVASIADALREETADE